MHFQLQQFKSEWEGIVNIRYCMGGLLPAWKQFSDGVNSVSRPAQMGPVWMQAAELSGMPIAHRIWVDDPPASSYPACIAVKSALLQSPGLGELYFTKVQEAIMLQGLNIARYEVLWQVAEQVAGLKEEFDINRFKQDMENGHGLNEFRKDVQEVKYRSINRFPTLLVRRMNQSSLLIAGYKTADVLRSIISG